MDSSSMGAGFMAVFAVSGSVVLLAHQVHKRLVSDFMKKIEFEFEGSHKDEPKKKVRFADDVVEPSSDNKEYRKKHLPKTSGNIDDRNSIVNQSDDEKLVDTMPLNWQVLYKWKIQHKTHRSHSISHCL
ncbi:hypothetical protein ACSBR2_020547 [Camellia fascicularis]